ncbi:MAG: yusI [Paenibacillaceae bacterium]|jgi:arsenate reductase|nr:yusI [Paenibacillaceae bacterium]
MGVTLYGYSKCGTCRDAQKWLIRSGIAPDFVDIVQGPLSVPELRKLVEQSGQKTAKFFNVSGTAYRELALKDKLPDMSEEEMLHLLSSNGMLLKRPIVTDGTLVTVGFREAEYQQQWANRPESRIIGQPFS